MKFVLRALRENLIDYQRDHATAAQLTEWYWCGEQTASNRRSMKRTLRQVEERGYVTLRRNDAGAVIARLTESGGTWSNYFEMDVMMKGQRALDRYRAAQAVQS